MTEPLRIIGDGRALSDARVPAELTPERLLTMYSWMVLLRAFDERAVALQRQGRIGTYPSLWGEEATQAGPLLACGPDDWVFPSYRQGPIGILRGLPPSVPLLYRRGFGGRHGFWNARRYRLAPACVPIATHLPHGVGLSWAAKLRGDSTAALVWSGDGATSEGDWHEALNFAAVFKTPTVFVNVNNQWAISTPFVRQSGTSTIAEKAAAYGIPGLRVDGFDPLACYCAARDALERGRAGAGPTLIEALTYRLGPHATADDPSRYRDEAETERWRALEPVGRSAAFLRRLRLLDDDRDRAIHEEARATMARAVDEVDAVEKPGPEIMFDPVYASGRPWTLGEEARPG